MEAVVCDISAFQYWRVPPVVRLLAIAPEGDEDLRRLFPLSQVQALRTEMAQELPLCRTCLNDGAKWRRAGEAARAVRDASLLLASGIDRPVDLLARSSNDLRKSTVIRTHLWSHSINLGGVVFVSDELAVTSPAFTLQQLATRASLTRTVMLASEVCGVFSVYRAPAPISRFLQRQIDAGRLPEYGGWSPCIGPSRKLTNLWRRSPLVTPDELKKFAELSDSGQGRARLLRAAELVHPNAASPFEARAGMLFGLPKRLGGEGLGGFEHNKRVELSGRARLLADQDCCYGDLVWGQHLDMECQGAEYHDNSRSYLSDSERTSALELMGYRVLPITHDQIANPARFDALADAAARILGVRRLKKNASGQLASEKLRIELFGDWYLAPFV